MDPLEAERIIESLRQGVPPEGHVADFTVGREEEIDELRNLLKAGGMGALLLKANYGSGKTHLLKLIREMALADGYAVSLITLDAQSAVRFNRMDQIFGRICRQLEVPNTPGKSVRHLFNAVFVVCSKAHQPERIHSDVSKLTSNGRWDYSSFLSSPALYVALRAWGVGNETLQDRIEDWLFHPWKYYSCRKELYIYFVENLRRYFRDPRMDWQFYADQVFRFDTQAYRQSWDALNDLDNLSKIAGFRGLVLFVDEFEDVIHNLRNKDYQQAAFWNLFQFFSGDRFNNLAFFAVTPDFVQKCKQVLLSKGVWDYDYSRFDALKAFEMSPLSEAQLLELGKGIVPVHLTAYDWSVADGIVNRRLQEMFRQGMRIPVQDRVRQTIRSIVKMLDEMMEEANAQ